MMLSIVIPAHNEEARIEPTLDAYANYFDTKYGEDYELVVVVNGSSDRTEAIVRQRAEASPRIRPIIEPRPIGKGGAVLLGFGHARGELVGFVDADGATPPDAYDELVTHIGDAAAIIANRWHPDAEVSPRQPFRRRVASRIFNALVRTFFGLRISDTQCGAKLVTREALEQIMPVLGLTRWAFDVDLLFQLRRRNLRISEWPTQWRDVTGSKLNVPRASLEMFIAICRLRLVYSPFHWIVDAYDRSLGRVVHGRHRE